MTDTADSTGISAQRFREVFRHHAAGVAVITTRAPSPDRRPVGFTATSLTSVSAEPPLVGFGLSVRSSSWPAFRVAPRVGIHLLADDQEELAAVFARRAADRFAAPTAWREGPYGLPELDAALAFLVCDVVTEVPAGDHSLFLARVLDASVKGGKAPLLYHAGQFNVLRR
ncbi:flavin reductase family protein [Streptomyces caniferus]|uniref:flavin reductase family protein n=1 Tax=Streptomyces caniferus TaxID=285557 RepID=UPI0033F9990D